MPQFHHDRSVGEHFLEMYASGGLLFPPDPLVDVAAEVLACREIPTDLVETALESFTSDPYGILPEHVPALRKEIATLATHVSYRRLLTDRQIVPLLADEKWTEKMLSQVKARAVAVRRVQIPGAGTDAEGEISG